jgi:beta-glucosidase
MSGEAASRAHPGLPGKQNALVEAVLARAQGKRVIAVLFSGRPLVVPHLVARVDAVLAAWSPGCEAGNALADLLTGLASPSGRTPMSWPRAVGQIPLFFGERPSGRPENPNDHFTSKYLDEANAPLFPFGHGLTYGDAVYTDLKVTPGAAAAADSFAISVTVTNRGTRAARETGFLFIHDPVARISRPVLELKGFSSLTLEPGQSGVLQFALPARAMTYPGPDLEPFLEGGDIEIFVGPSADPARLLSATVRLA